MDRWTRVRGRVPVLMALGGVVAVACLLWWGGAGAVWRALVPMARPGWDQLSATDRATAEASLRLAVIQASVAVGALVALVYTARNFRLTRRGQVTDRFTKALERLGSPVLYIRTGGILALEQIVQDARDQAPHAAQVLNAFLRDRTPQPPEAKVGEARQVAAARRAARRRTPPPTAATALPKIPQSDVQDALTALTRPASRRHIVVFQRINRIDLHNLYLKNARLTGADLSEADLSEADLTWADLTGANLTEALLSGAIFIGADLIGANLTEADLTRANLRNAYLDEANLRGAELTDANLRGAELTGANFAGADLRRTDLTDANLTGADLRHVRSLEPEQLLRAHFDGSVRNLPARVAADPAVAARLATEPEE
ncbi:pentapeptide repeat-containing protein [Streptomyces sp. NBC_00827]|uniref:pentapeptide repeat-containing protein n=1 Tax=Streptomyces sp. NBC_00827 TaxID=2903677 RepID=UPI003863C7B9